METEGKALDSDRVACHSTLDCTKFPEIDAPRCNNTGLYNKRGSSYWQSVLVVAEPCWYLQDKCQNEGGQHLQTLAFPQQITENMDMKAPAYHISRNVLVLIMQICLHVFWSNLKYCNVIESLSTWIIEILTAQTVLVFKWSCSSIHMHSKVMVSSLFCLVLLFLGFKA